MKSSPLRRTKGLKRTGFKRRSPAGAEGQTSFARSNKSLRPRSRKMTKKYREERAPFVKSYLAAHPNCEIRSKVCTGRSVDVHEPLTRARGGSITDPDNALAVCRACHQYAHEHPLESLEQGWLRRA